MLTIVLTWATLLWALALAGAFFVVLLFVASFGIVVDLSLERHSQAKLTDWQFVCRHWRWFARPVAYLAVKFAHIRASSLVGRALLAVYRWTR